MKHAESHDKFLVVTCTSRCYCTSEFSLAGLTQQFNDAAASQQIRMWAETARPGERLIIDDSDDTMIFAITRTIAVVRTQVVAYELRDA